jgi:hypothetical protein
VTSPAPPAPGTTDGPAEFPVTYEATHGGTRPCDETTESREFVFIYLTKTQAPFVPLRALSLEQRDAFWWVIGRWAPRLVRHSRGA